MSGVGPGPVLIPDSPLARCDPVAKLVVLTVVSIGSLLILDPLTPALLYLAAVPAVLVAGRIGWSALLRVQVPFAVFALGLLAVNAVTRPGTVVTRPGPLTVTAEGLWVGASVAMRVLVVGVLSVGFLVSTDPGRLMTALRGHLRLPPRLAFGLLAGHRLLQDLPAEWAQLRAAHRVRAPLTRRGRPRRPIRRAARCAFGLLVVSIRRGGQLAEALESRGLGLEPRTVWRPEAFGRRDLALIAAVVVVVVAVLGASAACGTLRGSGALFG